MFESPPVLLTFDDCLLLPGESEILPSEVDLSTFFTPDIRLNIPLVSAAMDTVTESQTAIAIAQAGGLGILHRNATPKEQAAEVGKVKKSESGMVVRPVTVHPDKPLAEAIRLRKEVGISGFVVVNEGKLVGILSNRDFQFEENLNKPIRDCMTPRSKLITAKEGIKIEEALRLLQENRIEKLPLVDEQDNLKGLITIKDLEKSRKFPNATKDAWGRLRAGGAIGTGAKEVDRAGYLLEEGCDVIVIDTAHGHTKAVLETLKACLKNHSKTPVVAGNVGTEEGAQYLIKGGAHAVKWGWGRDPFALHGW